MKTHHRHVLQTGLVRPTQSSNISPLSFDLVVLEAANLNALHLLEEQAGRELGSDYAMCSLAELRSALAYGMTIGVYCEDTLVGFKLVKRVDQVAEEIGQILGLPSINPPLLAGFIGTFVLPRFRRCGLARLMSAQALTMGAERGLQHVYATVAPSNRASLANLMALGFVIKGIQTLYGGHLRHVLYCDLEQPSAQGLRNRTLLRIADLQNQRRLLVEGFVGTGIESNGEEVLLSFGKPPGRTRKRSHEDPNHQ